MAGDELACRGWNLTEEGIAELVQGGGKGIERIIKAALDTDLRDIGDKWLSEDLPKGKLDYVQGPAVLQLMKLRNISAPKQNEESQTAPRLLRLSLTDGHMTCTAIELENLKHITLGTPPGTKVLLDGAVDVENNLLLLTNKNFRVLGGRVEKIVESWELKRKLAKQVRYGVQSEGGPPLFVPFGKKLQHGQEEVHVPRDKDGFKSLDVNKSKEKKEDDTEFEQQRQATIAVALQDGKAKTFGGGMKQAIPEKDVARIVEMGFSPEQALTALRQTSGDIGDAIGSLLSSRGHGGGRGGDRYERREPHEAREPRQGGRGHRGRDRDEDGDEVGSSRPSGPATLFDFLEDKIPVKEETKTFSASSRNASSNQDGGYTRNTSSNQDGRYSRNASSNQDGGYNRNSSSNQYGGYNRNSSSNQDGGYNSNSSSNQDGGYSHNASSNQDGGYNRNSSSNQDGGYNRNSSSNQDGGYNRNSSSNQDGGYNRNASSNQDGGYNRNASSNQDGGYSRNASSNQNGGSSRSNYNSSYRGPETSSQRPRDSNQHDHSGQPFQNRKQNLPPRLAGRQEGSSSSYQKTQSQPYQSANSYSDDRTSRGGNPPRKYDNPNSSNIYERKQRDVNQSLPKSGSYELPSCNDSQDSDKESQYNNRQEGPAMRSDSRSGGQGNRQEGPAIHSDSRSGGQGNRQEGPAMRSDSRSGGQGNRQEGPAMRSDSRSGGQGNRQEGPAIHSDSRSGGQGNRQEGPAMRSDSRSGGQGNRQEVPVMHSDSRSGGQGNRQGQKSQDQSSQDQSSQDQRPHEAKYHETGSQNDGPGKQYEQPQPGPLVGGGNSWKHGDQCLVKYWEDGQFYSARIEDFAPNGATCVVTFLEYGNMEEVLLTDVKPVMQQSWQNNPRQFIKDQVGQQGYYGNPPLQPAGPMIMQPPPPFPGQDALGSQINSMEFRRSGNGVQYPGRQPARQIKTRPAQHFYQPPTHRS